MARVFRRTGNATTSAGLLGAADLLSEQVGIVGADVQARDRAVSRVRGLLGPEGFESEWRAGRMLSFEAAVGFALEAADKASQQFEAGRPALGSRQQAQTLT
jgi:hypothetical protein